MSDCHGPLKLLLANLDQSAVAAALCRRTPKVLVRVGRKRPKDSAPRPANDEKPAANQTDSQRRSEDPPMPSERADDRNDSRCAKDYSQQTINEVRYCFLSNFVSHLRLEVLNHGTPESWWAATSVELPQRFDWLGAG